MTTVIPPVPPGAVPPPLASEPEPVRRPLGHSSNMVGVTSAYLASPDFNDGNEPLDLPHVRATTRSFFDMLAEAEDIDDAVQAFHAYMAATFCLEPDQYDPIERKRKGNTGRAASDGTRRFRSSYLRLLKGWMFETGGAEGAVLKGWVESRFGLLPTWHGEPITHIPCTAWLKYVEQKMNSRFHDNAIHCQLDLVFTFCQWVLRRFVAGETQHLVLYRGVNPSGEDMILERTDRRHALVRFNNLTSFTADKTVAECFGDWIITARVPVAKVVFYADLLPRHPLKGEAEYLVIGGDYRVEMAPL